MIITQTINFRLCLLSSGRLTSRHTNATVHELFHELAMVEGLRFVVELPQQSITLGVIRAVVELDLVSQVLGV